MKDGSWVVQKSSVEMLNEKPQEGYHEHMISLVTSTIADMQ